MPNLANSCAGSSARNLTQTRYARVLLVVLLAARLPYLTERTVVRVVMHKNLTQTRYARGFNTVRVLLPRGTHHILRHGTIWYHMVHPAAKTMQLPSDYGDLNMSSMVPYGTIP